MAAFLSRSVDGVLKRGSQRAAISKFWLPQTTAAIALTSVGNTPALARSDGADLWVATQPANTVVRVRASDGKILGTWTGAVNAFDVLSAMGRIFVTAQSAPGSLYSIDPTLPAGSVTTVASNLGNGSQGIAFDGARIWVANAVGSVSIVTPGSVPFTVTTVTAGFAGPEGALFDGSNVWVTDFTSGTLVRLSSAGAILQTVTVASGASFAVFDGSNIWVPCYFANSIFVVRASTGAVLSILTGNGLDHPQGAAFDGERVMTTNTVSSQTVSLWKAAELSSLGVFSLPAEPFGVTSDGVNFWITLQTPSIARF